MSAEDDLPETFEGLLVASHRRHLSCRGCGDHVRRKHLTERLCPGCRTQ